MAGNLFVTVLEQRHFGVLASGLLEMQHLALRLLLNLAGLRQHRNLLPRNLHKKDSDLTFRLALRPFDEASNDETKYRANPDSHGNRDESNNE